VWLHSPQRWQGHGEIRHLLLIAALFSAVPAMDLMADRVAVWRGIILTATVSSLVLIGHFTSRLLSIEAISIPLFISGAGASDITKAISHGFAFGLQPAWSRAAVTILELIMPA
jgi:hypothetical protein